MQPLLGVRNNQDPRVWLAPAVVDVVVMFDELSSCLYFVVAFLVSAFLVY